MTPTFKDPHKKPPQLTVRFPERTVALLVDAFFRDVIDGGMVVRTRWGRLPLRVGSIVRLRFELADGEEVLAGNAQVAAMRDDERQRATAVALRFRGLTRAGQRLYAALLERARGREALKPRFSGADFRLDATPRAPSASAPRRAPSRARSAPAARVASPAPLPHPQMPPVPLVGDDDPTIPVVVDPAFLASL